MKKISLVLVRLLLCLALLFPLLSRAESSVASKDFGKESVEIYQQLQQFWLLAHAYRYGVVVPKDKMKSIVYEMLYLHCLPKNYPFKSRLLSEFTSGVSENELTNVRKQADLLQKKLSFSCPVSDAAVKYGLAYFSDSYTSTQTYLPFRSLKDFMLVVKESSPDLGKKYEELIEKGAGRRERWVYGQLHLQGIEDPPLDLFKKISGLQVDDKGFFLMKVPRSSQLDIKLLDSLYAPLALNLSESEGQVGLINLNHLLMLMAKDNAVATVVGEHLEKQLNINNSVVLLREKEEQGEEPRFIYVTRLSDGKFYKKGLAPGSYFLYLADGEAVKKHEVHLNAGETKQLKPISLYR